MPGFDALGRVARLALEATAVALAIAAGTIPTDDWLRHTHPRGYRLVTLCGQLVTVRTAMGG